MLNVDKTVQDNMGLAYNQLKKFFLLNDCEAESLALEALFVAAETFNPTKGAVFSTYATVCIYNKLGCYVRTLHQKKRIDEISYNAVAYTDEQGAHEHQEFIEDPKRTEDEILRKELIAKTRTVIEEVLNRTPRGKQHLIVEAYVKSEFTYGTVELAKIADVSQSYASYVINIFKNKVKKQMEEYYNA